MKFSPKPLLVVVLMASGAAFAADFKGLDVDVDGRLSRGEMEEYSGVVQYWNDVDTDHNGYIDPVEFDDLVKNRSLAERTGWQKGSSTPDGASTIKPSGKSWDEFAVLDTNNDSKLSPEEMKSHEGMVKYWSEVDRNHDGYIDNDEFAAMRDDATLSERTGWKKSGSGSPTSNPGDTNNDSTHPSNGATN